MRNKQKGFTLIELLVVIVILGILSTISVGTFRGYFAKARDAERLSTVTNLAMMIKIDSGGAGDCGVYNYTMGTDTFVESGTACSKVGTIYTLLMDNDYVLPKAKNGLNYYYGFKLGTIEGNNDFFVAAVAEADNDQNSQAMIGTKESVFIGGTTAGMNIPTDVPPVGGSMKGCSVYEKEMGCGSDWYLYMHHDNSGSWLYVPTVESPPPPCVGSGCHEIEGNDTLAK